MERGPTEYVSNVLGSKSTNERFEMDKELQLSQEEFARNKSKKKLLTLWRDTGDQKYLLKLVNDFDFTDSQVDNEIQKQVYEANIPAITRRYMSKTGQVSDSAENQRKMRQIFKFGRQ